MNSFSMFLMCVVGMSSRGRSPGNGVVSSCCCCCLSRALSLLASVPCCWSSAAGFACLSSQVPGSVSAGMFVVAGDLRGVSSRRAFCRGGSSFSASWSLLSLSRSVGRRSRELLLMGVTPSACVSRQQISYAASSSFVIFVLVGSLPRDNSSQVSSPPSSGSSPYRWERRCGSTFSIPGLWDIVKWNPARNRIQSRVMCVFALCM